MEIKIFIDNYRKAFGEKADLPIAFWYSDTPVNVTEKINGCLFKGMQAVRSGTPISLNAGSIGCGGGKFYTGFSPMPEYVPNFVSLKEKYKQTPEMVNEFIQNLGVPVSERKFLNFNRIDNLNSFDETEGILFLANPDMLSGLVTWTYFDNNEEDGVTAIFGSGCSAIITQACIENKNKGRRTFLGLFDPSARPYFEADILSFAVPMSRFKEMYDTMPQSCLFDTHAWSKIKARINN